MNNGAEKGSWKGRNTLRAALFAASLAAPLAPLPGINASHAIAQTMKMHPDTQADLKLIFDTLPEQQKNNAKKLAEKQKFDPMLKALTSLLGLAIGTSQNYIRQKNHIAHLGEMDEPTLDALARTLGVERSDPVFESARSFIEYILDRLKKRSVPA